MADLTDIDLTLRAEEGVPLSANQFDANMQAIENAVNAINAKVNTLVNDNDTYGEMYQADNAVATTVAVANTWYAVANFSAGHLDDVTFSSNALVLPTAGDYLFLATVTVTGTTGNEIKIGVGLDGTVDENHVAETELQSTDVQAMTVVGVVEATAGMALKLYVKNVPATNNVTVVHATVVVRKIH